MALGSALLAAGSGAMCVAWIVALPQQIAEAPSFVWVVFARLLTLPILIICLAGVALFGYGLVFFLGRLIFFRRPLLEVGPEGLLDRASAVGVGFLPWEEVRDARFGYFGGQRMMSIVVENERELMGRQNFAKRLVMRLNRRYFTGTMVNIPLNVLAIPEEELLAEIKPHLSLPAQRHLDKLQQGVGSAGPEGGVVRGARSSTSTSTPPALRIAGSVVRGIALFVLSMAYYVTGAMLLVGGAAFAWNSLGPGRASGLAHPVAGVILLVVGVVWFIFFPRLIKKLTGREPISGPYYGP